MKSELSMEKIYQNEEAFLADYNEDQFQKLSLTTDILVFSVADSLNDNYRRLPEKHFSVLLVKRDNYPFKDKWCLPGGFLRIDEDIEDAPKRVLAKETNLHDIYLEQLYTFGDIKRDPRLRVINTAYLALVDKNRIHEELLANAAWFNITQKALADQIIVTLHNQETTFSFSVCKVINKHQIDIYDYQIMENEYLAFDNALVLMVGIERLRNKINYTNIVFNMMPEYFTLKELQQVYEVILDRKLLDPAFRRIINEKVLKTDRYRRGGGHRPSALYKYREPQMK